MSQLSAQQHASAHAGFQAATEYVPHAIIHAAPAEIVGTVTVTLNYSCIRACDQGRPYKGRAYIAPLHMHYAGSAFLLSHLPAEMDLLTNQVLTKIRAWEWRSKQDAAKQSQIHKRPGT